MTSVQECNKALTGVGPSIASVNQSAEKQKTDLTNSAIPTSIHNAGGSPKLRDAPSSAMQRRNARSPMRLQVTAINPARAAALRSPQWEINRNEIIPITSQNSSSVPHCVTCQKMTTEKKDKTSSRNLLVQHQLDSR
jgi:hypothetical protein